MAIIFWDFDGTLVYSNPLWSTTVFNSLKEAAPNTDVKFTDIRKCMATGFTWHTPDEDYSNLIGDKWWEFMNRKISDDYISLGVDADVALLKIGLLLLRFPMQKNNPVGVIAGFLLGIPWRTRCFPVTGLGRPFLSCRRAGPLGCTRFGNTY
ncbi:MAG: hypothetical protein PUE73_06785 [Eubacteriales bacterium]|nr:hypothetical protein [Eubacteriales bacterium]